MPRRFAKTVLVAWMTAGLCLGAACRQQDAGFSPAPARETGDAGGPPNSLNPDPNGSKPSGASDAAGVSMPVTMDASAPDVRADVAGNTCTPGAVRCAVGAAIVESCHEGGAWQVRETCTSICMNGACVGKCRPGDRRCGAANTPEECTAQGDWKPEAACKVVCAGAGTCVACTPGARRCNPDETLVQECKKDGSGYADSQSCDDGCLAGKCNVCPPGTKSCTGTTLRTCRIDGSAWDDQICKPPTGGGGQAVCADNKCDITCLAGRTKMGDRCACPTGMVACGSGCVAASETINVPTFQKACGLPLSDTCDPHNFPITISGCPKQVEVTVQTSATHCAPIYLQMLVGGVPKGPRTAAIAPGQSSPVINLGPLGPGSFTLGFQATVDRSGCGVGGILTNWGGSAKVVVTVR